jgi:hypothetical protein
MEQNSSFLSGLARLTGTIAAQAMSIASIRSQSALRRADADLEAINQTFVERVNSFQITPENFQAALEEHQGLLEEYAENFDFAPARETIKNRALTNFASLRAQAAAAMNKQQLALAEEDFKYTFKSLSEQAGLTAQARKDALLGLVTERKAIGGMSPLVLQSYEHEAEQNYLYGDLIERARSKGTTNQAIQWLSSQDNPEMLEDATTGRKAVPEPMRQAALVAFQKELAGKDEASDKEYSDYLVKAGDYLFPDVEMQVATIQTKDVSDAEKEKQYALLAKHQDDALYSYFKEDYAKARSTPGALRNLQTLFAELGTPANWEVGPKELERWIGPEQKERRQKLMDAIESDIERMKKAAESGEEDQYAKDATNAKAAFWQKYQAWKDGLPVNGKIVSAAEVYTIGLQYVNKFGNDVLSEVKDATEEIFSGKFIATEAKDSFDSFLKVINAAREQKKIPKEDLDFVTNQARDLMLANPSGTFDFFQKRFDSLKASVLTKQLDALKGERMQEGIGGIKGLAEIGVMVESGALGSVVNSDPLSGETEMLPSGQTRIKQSTTIFASKMAEYGITGTPRLETSGPNDGRTIVTSDKDGKDYALWFNPKNGEVEGAYEVKSDGSKGAKLEKLPSNEPKPPSIVDTLDAAEQAGKVKEYQKYKDLITKKGTSKQIRAMWIFRAMQDKIMTEAEILALGYDKNGEDIDKAARAFATEKGGL